MSTSFVTTSRSNGRTNKNTCRNCKRTVYVVTDPSGAKIETDPELINVVVGVNATKGEMMFARRVHGEMCVKYQADAARIEAAKMAKKANKAAGAPQRTPFKPSEQAHDVGSFIRELALAKRARSKPGK